MLASGNIERIVSVNGQRGVSVADLRGWRRQATLTQEQLAEMAGISRQTIMHAEQNVPISIPNVQAIAKALGISVQQLRFEYASQTEKPD
jgi:transcriptional regulator with XRE-family HTH domain